MLLSSPVLVALVLIGCPRAADQRCREAAEGARAAFERLKWSLVYFDLPVMILHPCTLFHPELCRFRLFRWSLLIPKLTEVHKRAILSPESVNFSILPERIFDLSSSRTNRIPPEQKQVATFCFLMWDKWRLEGPFVPQQLPSHSRTFTWVDFSHRLLLKLVSIFNWFIFLQNDAYFVSWEKSTKHPNLINLYGHQIFNLRLES